jgi:hypothetical protein
MKNILLLALAIAFLLPLHAQLKVKAKCNDFFVDLLNGKVNDVRPDFTNGQIKTKLPCFTGEDNESSKCGSVLYYRDRDMKFFTGRDYVEIGPAFKGKLSLPVMGAKRGSFFKYLGNPTLKDDKWDAFQTQYGCLILYYNAASRVNMIRFSTKTTAEIQLCE